MAIVRFHQEQGEGKAKQFLATAKRCVVCGGCMAAPSGRDRHFLCEPNSIIGRVCICSGRCSTDRYGDQGSCADGCEVCDIMRGQPLREPPKRRKSK